MQPLQAPRWCSPCCGQNGAAANYGSLTARTDAGWGQELPGCLLATSGPCHRLSVGERWQAQLNWSPRHMQGAVRRTGLPAGKPQSLLPLVGRGVAAGATASCLSWLALMQGSCEGSRAGCRWAWSLPLLAGGSCGWLTALELWLSIGKGKLGGEPEEAEAGDSP